jgi:hypothetical protein
VHGFASAPFVPTAPFPLRSAGIGVFAGAAAPFAPSTPFPAFASTRRSVTALSLAKIATLDSPAARPSTAVTNTSARTTVFVTFSM